MGTATSSCVSGLHAPRGLACSAPACTDASRGWVCAHQGAAASSLSWWSVELCVGNHDAATPTRAWHQHSKMYLAMWWEQQGFQIGAAVAAPALKAAPCSTCARQAVGSLEWRLHVPYWLINKTTPPQLPLGHPCRAPLRQQPACVSLVLRQNAPCRCGSLRVPTSGVALRQGTAGVHTVCSMTLRATSRHT